MDKLTRYAVTLVLLFATCISLWFLLNNLQPIERPLYSAVFVAIITLVLSVGLFAPRLTHWLKQKITQASKYNHFSLVTIIVVVLLAVLARLYFYFNFTYSPVSDPLTFYEAGQNIASGKGMNGNGLAAFFPYLSAYDHLLGFTMKLISSPWLATIALNTLFDIASACILYVLLRMLVDTKSYLPLAGFAVWLLNPLNIIYSLVSLPLIVVNFFIFAAVLIIHFLLKSFDANEVPRALSWALLLGVVLAIGNCFRPIFSIAIIALLLIFLYMIFLRGKLAKPLLFAISSLLLIMAVFTGVQNFNTAFVSRQTGLDASSNPSGWSIYVGSNNEYDGGWNQQDNDQIRIICSGISNNDKCHDKLKEAGIERYKSYGVDGTINLFIRKLYRFTNDQNYTYDALRSMDEYANTSTAKTMNAYAIIFVILMFLLSTKFLYLFAKDTISGKLVPPILLFVAILVIGVFLSIMLVESAPRYAVVLYPAFILFAVLGLQRQKINLRKN